VCELQESTGKQAGKAITKQVDKEKSMPGIGLDELPAGSDAEILTLTGGGSIVGRLAALGFVPGSRVSMVRNSGRGPLIVSVIHTRVALGRREALAIRLRRIG
jgi:Fe2+ transport system protein FeoA